MSKHPLPKVEAGTEEGGETTEVIKVTEELQQDRISHHCYRHTTDINLCTMTTPLTIKEPQTQTWNRPNSQLKGSEIHKNDMKRNQLNGFMRHVTSNHHMNNIMIGPHGREDQRQTLRIEENKETTQPAQTNRPQEMIQLF